MEKFLIFMGYKTIGGRWDWSEVRIDSAVVVIIASFLGGYILMMS